MASQFRPILQQASWKLICGKTTSSMVCCANMSRFGCVCGKSDFGFPQNKHLWALSSGQPASPYCGQRGRKTWFSKVCPKTVCLGVIWAEYSIYAGFNSFGGHLPTWNAYLGQNRFKSASAGTCPGLRKSRLRGLSKSHFGVSPESETCLSLDWHHFSTICALIARKEQILSLFEGWEISNFEDFHFWVNFANWYFETGKA